MASNVMMVLYNTDRLEKIVFVGVDAFHFGYSYRPDIASGDRHFYPIDEGGYDNPKITHGIPFLNFLFGTLEMVNQQRRLNVFFPKILINYIDFPKKDYIHFYN